MKTNIDLKVLCETIRFHIQQRTFSYGKGRKTMKIVLDEVKKEGVLLKNDGTEVSRYSYKGALDKNFTFEELKKDIESFNITLSQQDEFDDIRELSTAINLHNW